jgi:hypothetical protein
MLHAKRTSNKYQFYSFTEPGLEPLFTTLLGIPTNAVILSLTS